MTDINAITKRFERLHAELQRQIEESQNKIKIEAQAVIKGVFEEFFAKYPAVHSIGWAQYTPYFNDGEELSFRRTEINLYLAVDSFDSYGWYDGDNNLLRARAHYASGRYADQKEVEKIDAKIALFGGVDGYNAILSDFDKVKTVLDAIDEDYLEMLYGDHVSVLYTKDGVTVEKHDHD